MGDAAHPSDDEFSQLLQDSLKTWSSYMGVGIPRQAIDLKSLVGQTPPFLGGDGLASDETISFSCEEEQSTQGKDSLVINGRSTWRTSKGICDLQSTVLSKQLLLAAGSRLSVRLTEDSPFSDWPRVQGVSGYDKGNYLSVLYFAWPYILSARWVELLGRSADHECHMGYTAQPVESSPQLDEVPIDLGENAGEEEVFWWRAILCSDEGWDATKSYRFDNMLDARFVA